MPLKNPTLFTPIAKNPTLFNGLASAQTSYAYSSSSVPYDSPTLGYSWSNPVKNQLNQKNPVTWSPSSV